MADRTPVEELREAARLMRERAEAATPGPWRVVPGICGGETYSSVIGTHGGADDARTWLMATGLGCREADAGHAASWHPLPALAVADLLEGQADMLGAGCPVNPQMLTIARAYLGTGDPR